MKYYGLFKNNELIEANIIPIKVDGFETKEIAQNEYETFKTKQNLQLEQQNRLDDLTNWFKTTYRYKYEKYTRLIALNKLDDDGVDANKKLLELYEEAEIVAKEIRELRESLKTDTNQLTNNNQSVIMEVEN